MQTTEPNFSKVGREYFRLNPESPEKFFIENGKLFKQYKGKKGKKNSEATKGEYKQFTQAYLDSRFPQSEAIESYLYSPQQGRYIKAPVFWADHWKLSEKFNVWGIELLYTDLEKRPYLVDVTTPSGQKIKRPYTRLRVAKGLELTNHEGKELAKYLQLRGVQTRPYLTGLAHYYDTPYKRAQVKYLYITEGEFKAWHACSIGIPTIGLAGVHNFGESYEGNHTAERNTFKSKHPQTSFCTGLNSFGRWKKWGNLKLSDLETMLSFCSNLPDGSAQKAMKTFWRGILQPMQKSMNENDFARLRKEVSMFINTKTHKGTVCGKARIIGAQLHSDLENALKMHFPHAQGVVYLHDADAREGSEKRRLGTFYASARKFKLAIEQFQHSNPKRALETYYGHISEYWSDRGGKGLDDLIETTQNPGAIKTHIGLATEYKELKHLPKRADLVKDYANHLRLLKSEVKRAQGIARQISEGILTIETHQNLIESLVRASAHLATTQSGLKARKASFEKKRTEWAENPFRTIKVRPFESNEYFKFYDLKRCTDKALYDYFKDSNADAVRYNRSQVQLSPSGRAAYAITVDWFEVAMTSEIFLNLDRFRDNIKDIKANRPEKIQLGKWELIDTKTNAGNFKYQYQVYHQGVRFGVMKGGDMGGLMPSDWVSFKADNEQLYLEGFISRFMRFQNAIKATFNNFTKLDIALDFNKEFFQPYHTMGVNPIEFITKTWTDGRIEKKGKNCKYGSSGEVVKGKVKLNGARIGGGKKGTKTVSMYDKSQELMHVHKPYISEYHEENGIYGNVYRCELKLDNNESKLYKDSLKLENLDNPRFLIDVFQKSCKGFFAFVDGEAHSKIKDRRNRPEIKLFDFSDIRPVRWLERKRKKAKPEGKRSVEIQLKKFVRDYMATNDTDYLVMLWKTKERYGIKLDKIEYWYNDIMKENTTKEDCLHHITYGGLWREIIKSEKRVNYPLGAKPGESETDLSAIELIGYATPEAPEEEVEEMPEMFCGEVSTVYIDSNKNTPF